LFYAIVDDNQCIGAIQMQEVCGLEILNAEIHYSQVQVRLEELQNTVGFNDGMFAGLENVSNLRQRIGQLSHCHSDPIRPSRTRRKITATVGSAAALRFF